MAQKASTHGRSHHLWLPALLRIATGVLGSIPSHPLAYNCCEALVDGLLSLTIPARDTVSTNPSINAKQDAHTCVVLETVQSLVEQCHVFRDVSESHGIQKNRVHIYIYIERERERERDINEF